MNDAYVAAYRLVAMKRRTLYEVAKMLVEKGFDEEDAINAGLELVEERLIDDRDYAKRFIRDACKIKGYGRIRIEAALSSKGIETDVIAEMMDKEYYSSLSEHLKSQKDFTDEKERDRLIRRLMTKGYSYGEIKEALKNRA